MLAALDEVGQALQGVVDVDEARIERRHAESDRVWSSEVRNYARAFDQRPADRPGVVVGETHVRAAASGVARASQPEAQWGEALVMRGDYQLRERGRLVAQAVDPRLSGQ